MTDTTPEVEERTANPAVTFTVTPTRLGRHGNPEPFEVALPEHYRATAQVLAERIHKYVKPFLLSNEYEVVVDMRKMTFRISHNRFGHGRIEEKQETDVTMIGIPIDIIKEMRAGVQRWLDMMAEWEGKSTFESPQEEREMALGAGFLSGEAMAQIAKLDEYIAATEGRKDD